MLICFYDIITSLVYWQPRSRGSLLFDRKGVYDPGARFSKVPVTFGSEIKYSKRNIKDKSAVPG